MHFNYLDQTDPAVAKIIEDELGRQRDSIERPSAPC